MFTLLPLFELIRFSLFDVGLLNPDRAEWVGADNYRRMLTDSNLPNVVTVSVVYAGLSVLVITGGSVALGWAMYELSASVRLRTLLMIPHILPSVSAGFLMVLWLSPVVGPVNALLEWAGLGRIAFLSSTRWALPTLVGIVGWRSIPLFALIVLMALRRQPEHLAEAAAVDGASRGQYLAKVALPLLRPVIAGIAAINGLLSVSRLDLVLTTSGGINADPGGPVGATRLISFYVYENALLFQSRLGYAAALSLATIAVLAVAMTAAAAAGDRMSHDGR